MQQDFASAMVQPGAVRCIGIPLKPFSLGHLLLLRQMGSVFVTGGQHTYQDFISSAFICVHDWEQNQRLLRSLLRRWLFCKVWAALAGPFNIPIQAQVLAAHINDAREIPEQKTGKPGATRYLHSEWDTRIYKFLRSIGCGQIESLDMPLAVANALFIAHLEEEEKASFKVVRDDPISRRLSDVLAQAERGGFSE